MKRLYYCAALFAVIFAIILYGEHTVKTFQNYTHQTVLLAREQLTENDSTFATQTLSDGIDFLRSQENRLNAFLPHEILRELDAALHAARAYAIAGNKEEAFAELARAESCLYQMRQQFFKLI